MNPTTLHTEAQTVTLAIIAVVLPFAAFVVDRKTLAKGLLVFVFLVSTAYCNAQDKDSLTAKSSYKIDTIYKHKVKYPANKGLATATTGMNDAAMAQGHGEPATPMPNTPLIIVDRTYVADNFSIIKPADVVDVDTLNGAKPQALFGVRGANGVFLITTKKGRPGTTYAEQLSPYLSKVKYRTWVAINTKLADSNLVGLNTNDIIKLEFSKKGVESLKSLSDGHYPLLSIITRDYAREQYLNKICSVTTGFRTYLVDHNYDDSNVIYSIEGKFANGKNIEDIKMLYDLPVEKIKNSFFIRDITDKSSRYQEIVIRTKK